MRVPAIQKANISLTYNIKFRINNLEDMRVLLMTVFQEEKRGISMRKLSLSCNTGDLFTNEL